MNTLNLTAHASTTIAAPVTAVWDALTRPELIKKYMFGTTAVSDWKVGSPIVWKGEWKGKSYEDKGVILQLEPQKWLAYTHYSPLSGKADVAENYHTVTIELDAEDGKTTVLLRQDKNPDEQSRAHAEQNWNMMLAELKKLLEQNV